MTGPSQLHMPFEVEGDDVPVLPAATLEQLREVIARLLLHLLERQVTEPPQAEDHHDGG